ncbi:MAG: hypothetical protein JWQ93_1463 [Marmoricola sp.]|jgi:hypothetical protein|nr:hypothetical protein [Marmoricola sp.]
MMPVEAPPERHAGPDARSVTWETDTGPIGSTP